MTAAGIEVLLVEDDEDDAELMALAFKREGLTNSIHLVQDGAEALEFIFATGRYRERAGAPQPRLVLLDVKLPLVDGFEVLQRIKGDPATQRIPVVMMTSSRQERDLVRGYDLRANGYVVKPVEFEEFTRAVSACGAFWLAINSTPKSLLDEASAAS